MASAVGGGAAAGLLSGALSNQKEGGTDTGNVYGSAIQAMGGQGGLNQILQQANANQQSYSGDPTKEFQSNPMFAQTFGQGGTLDRTNQEEQNLSSRGFSLKPEDYEAYGQASGNIARMFGQNDQSMSQALADRGLSSSGAAGAAFSGSMGNKQEQLAGLQRQIANDRMNMNMQRLGQTRNFLSQLNGQAMQGENQTQQLGRQQAQDYNQVLNNKAGMAMGLMGNYQDQQNAGLQQQQQTAHSSTLSNMFQGGMAGGMAGGKMASGMSGGAPSGTQMAGQSSSTSMFA